MPARGMCAVCVILMLGARFATKDGEKPIAGDVVTLVSAA
jgi:hypothetical protein